METKNIIVLGGGGHAKVITSVLLRDLNYNILGFLDDDQSKKEMLGTKRLGDLIPANNALEKSFLAIGIGHLGDTKHREEIIEEYRQKGHIMEKVIAPTAIINHEVTLGNGVVILDGVILQPSVTIGDYSIINTKASVDHDCHIGNHVHIAPGVTLSGNVTIGNRVLIGTGASVIQGVTIEDDCIIGAGSVITHNCDKKGGVYVGSPARLIKEK